jgi:hypothetical protein
MIFDYVLENERLVLSLLAHSDSDSHSHSRVQIQQHTWKRARVFGW